MTRHVSRAALASAVLAWTADTGRPLVVGNGFLSREVVAAGDGDHVVHLLAGMGLAPAVAAGMTLAGRPAAALEGDGNHLMGLSGTATIGLAGIPLTHIVHWNGGWESTGGQRVVDPGCAHDVGATFGYATTETVDDPAALQEALTSAANTDGPTLIHVIGAMGDPPAPRSALTMTDFTTRFRHWTKTPT
ncbi:thiamine pyrophosphate-dependent enzyme [Actinomadura sp. 1N219]|uniref:thiamine pyrophosphate-dependent enzyme n=1 Tax=Actinomadura sp. 1N219 TaxID=3375152 RepID=UPI0037A7F03C